MADTIPKAFTVPLAEYTRLAAERDRLAAELEAMTKQRDAANEAGLVILEQADRFLREGQALEAELSAARADAETAGRHAQFLRRYLLRKGCEVATTPDELSLFDAVLFLESMTGGARATDSAADTPNVASWADGDVVCTSYGMIEDGFGGAWPLCKPGCRLQIVRPGKVQCDCDSAGVEQQADQICRQNRTYGERLCSTYPECKCGEQL